MAKNPEELYEQKEFEQKHYVRPTKEQLKIKRLEQQLKHAQESVDYYEAEIAELEEELALTRNTNDHLDNELEKRINTLDLINGLIRDERTSDMSDEMFKFEIMRIVGWRL